MKLATQPPSGPILVPIIGKDVYERALQKLALLDLQFSKGQVANAVRNILDDIRKPHSKERTEQSIAAAERSSVLTQSVDGFDESVLILRAVHQAIQDIMAEAS